MGHDVMRGARRRWALLRGMRSLAAIGGVLLLAGCELAAVNVAPPAPAVVVHAVLNPNADEQVVLVESSLTGRVEIDDEVDFDPLDPIRTAGGEPLSGADVRLFPSGDAAGVRATETRVGARGTGRYAVPRAALTITPGQRYRLRVITADGRTVTGETRVPGAPTGWSDPTTGRPAPVPFVRDRDTLQLTWPAIGDARTYAVRVQTPYGVWAFFSDSTRFALSGGLRNFLAPGLPSVWFPGFTQTATVVAVDRNFYDYNRSGNDPFGGTGLISSVSGGIGLFGSLVELLRREVVVTQTDRTPLDAAWQAVGDGGGGLTIDLWLADPGPRFSAVSGRIRSPERSVIGTLADDGTLRLAALRGTSSADTAGLFTGRLAGDSIVGSWSARFPVTGPPRFRRTPR